MESKFEISVIIKAKGKPEAVVSTMESLEKQSLPFARHIQVIFLLDKKAKPEVCECCKKYQKRYPNQIFVLKKMDMSVVRGEFVSILWEGREWEKDSLKSLLVLRQKYPQEIDLAIEKSGNWTDSLEYAVNCVEGCPDDVSRYFFSRKYDVVLSKIIGTMERLDIMYGLAQSVTNAEKVGLLRSAERNGKKTKYKKRTREWYLEKMPAFCQNMQKLMEKIGEERETQLEFFMMREIAEAVKGNAGEFLSETDILTFENWLRPILQKLDDYVISIACVNAVTRRYIFSLKYGKDMAEELVVHRGKFYYKNLCVYNMANAEVFRITDRKATENGQLISGLLYHSLPEKDVEFFFTDGEKEMPLVYQSDTDRIYWCVNQNMRQEKVYTCVIPKDMNGGAQLVCRYQGRDTILLQKLEELQNESIMQL